MNISEANAVNALARALGGIPSPTSGEIPSRAEQQDALDLLLAGAHRKLSAGLRPGEVLVLPRGGGQA